jgi:hypothetical protein
MIFSEIRYFVQCDYCGREVLSPTTDSEIYVVIPDEWFIEREAIVDLDPNHDDLTRDGHFCSEQCRTAWKALGVVSSVAGAFPAPSTPLPPTNPNRGGT